MSKRTPKPKPHVIVYGNPVDGFKFIGPFPTHEEAIDYAADTNDSRIANADWTTAPLAKPKRDLIERI